MGKAKVSPSGVRQCDTRPGLVTDAILLKYIRDTAINYLSTWKGMRFARQARKASTGRITKPSSLSLSLSLSLPLASNMTTCIISVYVKCGII